MRALIYGAIILALTFDSAVVYSKTAETLISEVRILSRDPSATGRTRFTNSQILDFINEGQRDTISGTLCVRKEYTFDTSSGTAYYAMPGDFIRIDRVLSDSTRLEEKSPLKLDQESDTWEDDTGPPTVYFINYSSRTKLGLYPYPVTGGSTTTIKTEYYAQVYDLSTSSTPFNSITELIPYQQMLVYYAASQMLNIDGFTGMADRYMQRYVVYKTELIEYCRNKNALPNKQAAK